MLEFPPPLKLSRAGKDVLCLCYGEKAPKIKTSAKGDKPAITKSKGLTVLSEVAFSKAEQMNMATKRSLKEFHISYASGSSDGVDICQRSESEEESWTFFSQGEDKEEDEEHDSDDDNDDEDDDKENDNQRTESDDKGDDFVHLNLSTYITDDQEKEKEEEKADDDDDDVTSDQKVSTPPDYELTEEDENQQDDDTMGEEPGDEDNGELYGDLNINLSRSKSVQEEEHDPKVDDLEEPFHQEFNTGNDDVSPGYRGKTTEC
ncbi:hypothetical protein Tco_0940704 [Tanacetum coccineum]|uniref:Uncharacterized protein n=1 Tax=Tanacetum coccineum TaxID=301880 RepID=A0ABQ5DVH1_9ASTR